MKMISCHGNEAAASDTSAAQRVSFATPEFLSLYHSSSLFFFNLPLHKLYNPTIVHEPLSVSLIFPHKMPETSPNSISLSLFHKLSLILYIFLPI